MKRHSAGALLTILMTAIGPAAHAAPVAQCTGHSPVLENLIGTNPKVSAQGLCSVTFYAYQAMTITITLRGSNMLGLVSAQIGYNDPGYGTTTACDVRPSYSAIFTYPVYASSTYQTSGQFAIGSNASACSYTLRGSTSPGAVGSFTATVNLVDYT
ncbi:MAG: hypothetical protein ABR548_08790 [Actinomycetota bacterium]|nr:hypothetical protein [Actinomycetota bacterium]